MTAVATLTFHKGDTEEITGTVTDVSGNPQIIQGENLVFSLKKYLQDSTDVVTKDSVNPAQIVILDDGTVPTRGQYKITLVPADLRNLAPGFYVYSIRLTYTSGKSKTVVEGTALVVEDVADG